jgi:hypothetical protein
VPWYVEAKAEQGSFATFLGLELMPVNAVEGTWQATAIGDCCLDQDLCASARRKTGTYGPGDAFALMTDAVAHWFLAHVALHPEKLSDFLQLLREDITGLCDGLMDARDAGQLRNDDIGLLFIECLPAPITTLAATP